MKKKVLVAVLNWGLGHAVRSIPVVKAFLDHDYEVLLGGNGSSGEFLHKEFPQLRYVEFPSFEMKYSSGKSQVGAMLLSLPHLFASLWKDHQFVCRLVKEESIDVVFSDNRFGLYCKNCHTVYMTHQLLIKMPGPVSFLEPLLKALHGYLISKYDECWVPDFSDMKNLAGDLSHPQMNLKVRYVGPLSRFPKNGGIAVSLKYKFLFILSGVEPQRSILEKKILNLFEERVGLPSCLLVRGVESPFLNDTVYHNLKIENVLSGESLLGLLQVSDCVVCRSGYTSIMELASISHKAVLIPTPGQTEQEYLANYLSSQYSMFASVNQNDLSWRVLFAAEKSLAEEFINFDPSLLEEVVERI
ncbi:MAG TPA: glycosyltransferase [Paludibacteraceae bacterium]|mgnify:CR=1 FL=1|nr:glycosyltransferase [Paludibacteraceae bacterium]HPH62320.1 glycosyltransferase [Paludibacteraceae bacterium]